MNTKLEEKTIGELFKLSVMLKGVHAVIEIAGGLLLFALPSIIFSQFAVWLTQAELLDDPNDAIANYVLNLGTQLSLGGKIFGGLYLLSHGLVKIVLVAGLLRNKLWAYPWSLVVLSMFIAYQLYRYTFTHSIGLVLLTVFDLVVMWLIWKEYHIVKKHLRKETQTSNIRSS